MCSKDIMSRQVWEGWTVGDFIGELLPQADMMHVDVQEILKRLAAERGTTVEEVIEKTEKAIAAGQGSPAFKEQFGDRIPSVEEFVQTMANPL